MSPVIDPRYYPFVDVLGNLNAGDIIEAAGSFHGLSLDDDAEARRTGSWLQRALEDLNLRTRVVHDRGLLIHVDDLPRARAFLKLAVAVGAEKALDVARAQRGAAEPSIPSTTPPTPSTTCGS